MYMVASYQVQVLITTWSQVRQVKVRVAVSASTLAPTSPPTGTAPAYLSSTDTSPSPCSEEGRYHSALTPSFPMLFSIVSLSLLCFECESASRLLLGL